MLLTTCHQCLQHRFNRQIILVTTRTNCQSSLFYYCTNSNDKSFWKTFTNIHLQERRDVGEIVWNMYVCIFTIGESPTYRKGFTNIHLGWILWIFKFFIFGIYCSNSTFSVKLIIRVILRIYLWIPKSNLHMNSVSFLSIVYSDSKTTDQQ